ncbi:bifunctional GNAT family N-acetyltransferase/hotdog fold thioesterase [Colwellia sp. 1_MG-2023]|uniref:bifunctional GNAT family N-acetyltransferase/hotdog fold thioesterase n=1 Tax=Colwellia sp. 1_MG-2023 TaxID=3062649 RepID=UPI0026E41A45|nr:bifunctional GNAT family N-acetyltransferase/hotdog fold thioesterase [Colwellia sp. 1_MG-2023]MDO6444897.1 bifunctional GNAT family N-acetyltransferase/hotdog fold thioesterase [Colwellia sp. 1_MG-2023]
MITCRAPKTKKEFEQYYYLRWLILRSPWGKERGSELDELEDQAIHRCIFDPKGNVVAVGRLHFTQQYHAQIRYMAVADTAQGQGMGKRLLDTLEEEAQKRGAISVELNAREIALAFYQKSGYLNIGKAHLLYGDIQHYAMTKKLSVLPAHFVKQADNLMTVWHNTIPLSKAMNINIGYYDGLALFTHCEPAFNKNLHNTMFAGSIYTLATLTGWGWIYLYLQNNQYQGDIVLAEGNIKYLAPITGVSCAKTDPTLVTGNADQLEENGKARITITVNVYSGDKVAAIFIGKYAIINKDKNQC